MFMGELVRKFTQLNGRTATIILEHKLFDKQNFEAQEVNVFEDKDRLGLIIKGQAVFIYKDRLRLMKLRDHIVEFADDKLKISIKF
jgi:predicted metallo-beta-lactamase superfamily hydrolase